MRHDDLAASNESSRASEVWLSKNVGCLGELTEKDTDDITPEGVSLRARAKKQSERKRDEMQPNRTPLPLHVFQGAFNSQDRRIYLLSPLILGAT